MTTPAHLSVYGLIQLRSAVATLTAAFRGTPGLQRHLDAVGEALARADYALAQLAISTGGAAAADSGTVYGALADPDTVAAAERWIKRGRQTADLPTS